MRESRVIGHKDRSHHEPPQKPGGEGWLYSEQQQPPKQKPLAKAPKSGRKPQNRKPPKR